MDPIRAVNLSLQIWGSIISFMIICCMIFPGRVKRKSDHIYLQMLVLNIGSMLCDAIAYYFRGKTGFSAWLFVRLSNYLAFFCNILLAFVFLQFQRAYLERRINRSVGSHAITVGGMITAINMLLLTVNLFYPFYYKIDERNIYSRQPYYFILYIGLFLIMIIGLAVMIKYWKFWLFRHHCG